MRTMSLLVVVGSLVSLSACGGSNPGGGTKTLFVKAQAQSDGSTDGTSLAVEVRQGTSDGQLITDAVVTVKGNKTGEFSLPWEGVSWGSFRLGAYRKSQATWDTGWRLSVKRGTDALDAYVEAPGITTITNPIGGTTFRRADGKPLLVQWKDSDGRRAQVVTIDFDKADGADTSLAEDRLEHSIEQNRLVVDDKERVEVRRKNEIQLAGGTPGSIFSATTEHRIEFRVE